MRYRERHGDRTQNPLTSMIGLIAGRIGQLFNATDIAKIVGVDTTTVQSWVAKLERNAILRTVRPYYTKSTFALNPREGVFSL